MTLNYILVDMICFLCSMIFSVILILFRLGYVSTVFNYLNVSKSVVMLIGTRQKTNHHNVSVHISGHEGSET